MNKKPRVYPAQLSDPCPCDSGLVADKCCRRPDGTFSKAFSPAIPPGQTTGYNHPSCYLAGSMNCSEDISREHYVSRAVLEGMGEDFISITGMPWLPTGESKTISINNATAKILCSRHNESLSHLDDEAGRFFRTLRGISENLLMKSLSRRGKHFLFSGLALEMWMVKAACGIFFSRIASKEHTRLVDDHTFDIAAASEALTKGTFLPRAGMYLQGTVGSQVDIANVFQISPLLVDSDKKVIGARESFLGHKFDIVFDTHGITTKTKAEGFIYRPSEIVLTNGIRSHLIQLSWPFRTAYEYVELTGSAPTTSRTFDPTKI